MGWIKMILIQIALAIIKNTPFYIYVTLYLFPLIFIQLQLIFNNAL